MGYLYQGGPPPPYPYPLPGGDPVGDSESGWHQGIGGDLGCSFETFFSGDFEACFWEDQSRCRWPIRHFIDLSPWE